MAAGKDVDSVLDPGTPFLSSATITACRRRCGPVPPSHSPKRRSAWGNWDAGAALKVLATARDAGLRHLIVLGNRFEWVNERPGVAAHLTQDCTTLLDNERVRVFALGGAA